VGHKRESLYGTTTSPFNWICGSLERNEKDPKVEGRWRDESWQTAEERYLFPRQFPPTPTYVDVVCHPHAIDNL